MQSQLFPFNYTNYAGLLQSNATNYRNWSLLMVGLKDVCLISGLDQSTTACTRIYEAEYYL